jgi:FAD/FMN-containing dehydrogenase
VYQVNTRALLRPGTVLEVQQIVKACRKHNVPLVPQGGNTGYCTGATPNADGCEFLSFDRMTAIREVDVGNRSITADAGAMLASVQAVASDAGLLMPLGLGSQASCTLAYALSPSTTPSRSLPSKQKALSIRLLAPHGAGGGLRR